MPEIKNNPWFDKEYKKHSFTLNEPGLTVDDIPERLGLLDDDTSTDVIEASSFVDLSDTPSDYGKKDKFARTDGSGVITWEYPFWKPSGRGIYYGGKVAVGHSHPKADLHLFKPATSCTFRVGAKQNPWVQWETTDENVGFSAGISDSTNKKFYFNYDSPIGTVSKNFYTFDAGNNRIGAFTTSPQVSYHIKVSACSSATYHTNTVFAVESTDNTMIQVSAGTNAGIIFCDAASNPPPGAVIYDHGDEQMEILAGGNEILYIKDGWVSTANGVELVVGDATATNPFVVWDEGTTYGWGGSYGGVVARFRASEAKHTSICIDAQTGYDPILGFSENGSVVWAIRNDASDTDNFEIRYHVGEANRTDFQITNAGAVSILTADLTLADGVGFNLQEDITFAGATGVNLIKMPDNLAEALVFKEDTTAYQTFVTTNDGEKIVFGKLFEAPTGCSIGTMLLADGSITDSGDKISFGNEYLYTTGNIGIGADKSAYSNVGLYLYGGAGGGSVPHASDDIAVFELDNSIYFNFISPTNKWGGIIMSDDVRGRGAVLYNHSNDRLMLYAGTAEKVSIDANGNVGIKQTTFGTNAVGVFAQGTETAPTTSPADCFQMYSADQVAGNACPFIRTEDGSIVKIYQQALIADPAGQVNDLDSEARTAINSILDLLENNGLMASA